MIVCPNCHHKELTGALFCSECGAQLIAISGNPTQAITPGVTNQFITDSPIADDLEQGEEFSEDTSTLAIHILDAGQIVPLTGKTEFTIGRSTEGQTVLPDIDLTAYRAYEKGISRLHASIHIESGRITLIDLGSVNGTRLNGMKIPPHQPHPIKHGDILALGKLKVQVLTHQ